MGPFYEAAVVRGGVSQPFLNSFPRTIASLTSAVFEKTVATRPTKRQLKLARVHPWLNAVAALCTSSSRVRQAMLRLSYVFLTDKEAPFQHAAATVSHQILIYYLMVPHNSGPSNSDFFLPLHTGAHNKTTNQLFLLFSQKTLL